MRLQIEMSVEETADKLWAVRDGFARVGQTWTAIRRRLARPEVATLAELPDHILTDIGLTRGDIGVALDTRDRVTPARRLAELSEKRRAADYAIATSGTARLSSEETMWPASASISGERSSQERARAISHMGRRGKPSLSERTRIPGLTADSGRTDTARPARTAAPTPVEFQLANSTL